MTSVRMMRMRMETGGELISASDAHGADDGSNVFLPR